LFLLSPPPPPPVAAVPALDTKGLVVDGAADAPFGIVATASISKGRFLPFLPGTGVDVDASDVVSETVEVVAVVADLVEDVADNDLTIDPAVEGPVGGIDDDDDDDVVDNEDTAVAASD
jgi:hypothetical protein